jgi:hypothetical protein
MKLFSPSARRELLEQGVLDNNFIQDRSISATKKMLEKLDKGVWFFFDQAEKINRGSAYLGAKGKALRAGLPEQEAIDYAKSIVRKTQFAYDSVDTPVIMSPDILKTMFQFQTFTTKQTEFLIELLQDRNFAGLIRYGLAGMAFVYTIGQAFGMEPKELLPIYRFDTPPSLKLPVELIKAGLDAPDKYGNDRDLGEKLEDIGRATTGLIPGGSQLKKSIQGYEAVQQGESQDAAGRHQFDVGGSTAEDWQAILFGKYATPGATEYFDRKENPKKKSSTNPFLK